MRPTNLKNWYFWAFELGDSDKRLCLPWNPLKFLAICFSFLINWKKCHHARTHRGPFSRKRKPGTADKYCLQIKTQTTSIFFLSFLQLQFFTKKIFIFLEIIAAKYFSITPIFILYSFWVDFCNQYSFYSVLLMPIEAQIFLANFQSSIGLKLSFKS